MDFKPPLIDEQYIKLLEQSNLDLKRRSKVFSYKNILVYSGIFILSMALVFGLIIYRQNTIDFDGKLKQVAFDAGKLLLEYNHTYYEIPDKEKKFLVNDACMLRINGQRLQFDNLSKTVNKESPRFKIFVPSNKHYTLVLADGTSILLNENSKIDFVNHRQAGGVNVRLQGEAFFKVAHNPQSVFKIQASDMLVKVYGTSFDLFNNPSGKTSGVALLNGSVKVETPHQSRFIVPGQQAILDRNQKLTIKPADFSQITAWIDNSIYFKAERLIDITQKLEKRYHVKFEISDPELQNLKFTGIINKNDDLLQFLKILNYTEDISYTIENKLVTLTKNHL